MLKRIKFTIYNACYKVLFFIPKYTSNVLFNNWCYRLADFFDEKASKNNSITIDELEKRIERIERYLNSFVDDGK